jgi:hypothetical protein
VVTYGKETVLVVFHITVAENCPVKAKGLETIVQAFAPEVREKVTRKILCFVTPLGGKLCTVQPYHNDYEIVSENLPAEVKYFQYVLNYRI